MNQEKDEMQHRMADIRLNGEGEAQRISGHAAVFNVQTTLYPGLKEQIRAGAFTDSIGKDDIRGLFNHDPNIVLGRNKNGSLNLQEDATGLHYEIQPPDTQQARDVVAMIKSGLVSQSSFAFRTIADEWDETDDGTLLRTLTKVKLFDVSPVTYGQYTQTDVGMRTGEELLAEGKAILAAGKKAIADQGIKDLRRELDLLELSS